MKVKVSQKDGEIVINRAGTEKTYKVNDGEVTVTQDELAGFLALVPDSQVVTESRSSSKDK